MFQKWMKRVTVFVLKMQPLSVSSRMTIPAKDETLTVTVITMVCMCTHKKTRTHVYVHVHVNYTSGKNFIKITSVGMGAAKSNETR